MPRTIRWVAAFTLLGLLITACSKTLPPQPASSRFTTTFVPLPVPPWDRSDLNAVDFVMGPDRTLHCVSWVSYGPKGSSSGSKVYYHRGTPRQNGWSWAPPREIESTTASDPTILVAGKSLHIFTNYFLKHYKSDDGGLTWNYLGQHLGLDKPAARGLDVAADGETIIVAYISPMSGDPTELHVLRWRPDGPVTDTHLEDVPVGSEPAPRLLFADGLHMVVPGRDSSLRFDHLVSDDHGRQWRLAGEVPSPRAGIPELALSARAGHLVAFRGLDGLFRQVMEEGSSWTQPVPVEVPQIADYFTGVSRIQAISTTQADFAVWIQSFHPRHGLPLSAFMPRWYELHVAAFAASGSVGVPVDSMILSTRRRGIADTRAKAVNDTLYVLEARVGPSDGRYDPDSTLALHVIPLSQFPRP